MTIFNIRKYGACGDGVTDDTVAVQTAIDRCSRAGGGRVLCPAGTYFIHPLVLRSGVDLHLEKECVLQGSSDPAHYTDWQSERIVTELAPYNAKYLLVAEDETDLSLTGKGIIRGSGPAFYDVSQKNGLFWQIRDGAQRPGRMIWLIRCRNVTIEEISLHDSPAWTLWLLGCENVRVHNADFESPFEEINADGIDVDSCRDVQITNSRFCNGDDCIVLRAKNQALREVKPCENVRVDNCTLQSNCNAIRVSYSRDGTVRNAAFTNINISRSRRGIICQIPSSRSTIAGRVFENGHFVDDGTPDFTNAAPHPVVENLSFSNISVQALLPIWFYLDDDAVARRVTNVCFENLELIAPTTSVFKGNRNTPLENISLRNVRVTLQNAQSFWGSTPDLEEKAAVFQFKHCCNVTLENLIIEGEAQTVSLPLFDCDEVDNAQQRHVINGTSLQPQSAAE
jgi:hypothetical protein